MIARRCALFAAALLSGCAVGPDFHTPAPPAQTAYDRQAPAPMAAPAGVAGGTQTLGAGAPQDGFGVRGGGVIVFNAIRRYLIFSGICDKYTHLHSTKTYRHFDDVQLLYYIHIFIVRLPI